MTNNIRTIEVVEYDEKWNQMYLAEAKKIKEILKEEIINIYHIGSTSIPNMDAKPVIDIMIEVKNINNIDKYNDKMSEINYIAKGEYGIEGRRFFLKGLYKRTHHVHIFQKNNKEIKRHINFRDYMISNQKEAIEYSTLKKKLAVEFRHDIDGYCKGKDLFIKNIDKKAKIWSENKDK